MRIITADHVERALDFPALIERLAEAFAEPPVFPERHHHRIEPGTDRRDATLLLMPAWRPGGLLGVKTVTIYPDNTEAGLPAVHASYQVFDCDNGTLQGMIDGKALTNWRTAAVSALAAKSLVRTGAQTLLIVGTGALAPYMVRAHHAVHTYKRTLIWGRRSEKAATLAADLAGMGIDAEAVPDLDDAIGRADTITTATLSTAPLIRGDAVRPGTHVDLVGAFRSHMRESDDRLMARARIFVDNIPGIMAEGGDVLAAIEAEAIGKDAILGDLFSRGADINWRRLHEDEVTVFKSVGCAPADFAAAELIWQRITE